MSMQTLIRILPLQDIVLKGKGSIDTKAYEQHSNLPPLSVAKVFADYGQLKLDLEECGELSDTIIIM